MEFVKMSKQEVNICIWELINKREDNYTWECFKRLQKPKSFVVSLYKKTCKLNNLTIEEDIIQKILSSLDDKITPVINVIDKTDEQEDEEEYAVKPMITRKRK